MARDLSVLQDAETAELTPAALSDWLAELLPSCFLAAPTGEVMLVDWFHLDLVILGDGAAPPEFPLRACGCPGRGELSAAAGRYDSDAWGDSDHADPTLLDVAMWSLPVFADLLASADLTLSASGRYLLLESAIPLDGELTHFSALLDTATASAPLILGCDLGEEELPPPADPTDDPFPTLRGEQAAPGAIA